MHDRRCILAIIDNVKKEDWDFEKKGVLPFEKIGL